MTHEQRRAANALARELWAMGHMYEAYRIMREVIKDSMRDKESIK